MVFINVYCFLINLHTYYRYAIGNAERPILKSKIGWLDILANDTHEYYYPNNTGGPSIKVSHIWDSEISSPNI